MELALPPDLLALERPVTVDEVMQLPEGPPYFELFDGEVIEVPPPSTIHQIIVDNLQAALRAACPPHLRSMFAPTGWAVGRYELYEPDVIVVRRELIGGHLIEETPELCVEILSPGNRRNDLIRKRRSYERAAVPSYWTIDPDPPDHGPEPRLTVLEMTEDSYVEIADGRGDDRVELARPFPVTIVPAELIVV